MLALFIKAYLVQPYIVDGQSMEPTLHNSDRLIVDKLPHTIARINNHAYIPKRGDIIIFNQDNLPGYTGSKQLVKRVIGLPGDKVVVNNGFIAIYNKANQKGFNPDKTVGYKITAPYTGGDVNITLGTNQLFVCGDNRGNSEDSRYFGPIDSSQVVGKLSLRVWPIGHAEHF